MGVKVMGTSPAEDSFTGRLCYCWGYLYHGPTGIHYHERDGMVTSQGKDKGNTSFFFHTAVFGLKTSDISLAQELCGVSAPEYGVR